MRFHLSAHSSAPAYVQIIQQVRQALLSGVLRPGDRLPTVKDVVADLAINPNTVLKAYRELELEGLVEGRQGVGTYARRRPEGPPPATQALLARGLARWVEKASAAGLDAADMESMLHASVRATLGKATA